MKATTITLVDGVCVIVPDSLSLNTTYVLREQEDWFEDEIKFLRRLLRVGDKVIDIGANYGVYTLTMAKLVGGQGSVWAFEPASMTASFLAKSIVANNFDQVVLEQSAVSNVTGTAQLSLNDDSELNALVYDKKCNDDTETVALTTLDECLEIYDWSGINYLKLDAEGEEANILRGGVRFFAEESPLVQYEVKAGAEMHLELVQAFSVLGYTSYRLVPGLNILVPFDKNEPIDGYLINLFSCKKDCADQLADRGFLADVEAVSKFRACSFNGSFDEGRPGEAKSWLITLLKLPYGKICAGPWQKTMYSGMSSEVNKALSLYESSRNLSLVAAERFVALEESFRCLRDVCGKQPTFMRQSSLARVAREYGARAIAVEALVRLCDTMFKQRKADLSEPFLAPGEYFDLVDPSASIGNWIAAAALEELERNSVFSSYYSGYSALNNLELIHKLGFGSTEMMRRLELVKQRFGS